MRNASGSGYTGKKKIKWETLAAVDTQGKKKLQKVIPRAATDFVRQLKIAKVC